MAQITTSDLVVRSAPGLGADSQIQPLTLSAPSIVYVIDGYVVADGFAWYLVDPVRPTLLGDWPTAGWVAAGGKDGEPWMRPAEVECHGDPTIEDLVSLAPQVRLYCYSRRTLMVDAIADECGVGIVGSGLPWGSACVLSVPGQVPAPSGCVDVCAQQVEVWFNNLVAPVVGIPMTVTGHFDDPECARLAGEAQRLVMHRCRLAFVATSLQAR